MDKKRVLIKKGRFAQMIINKKRFKKIHKKRRGLKRLLQKEKILTDKKDLKRFSQKQEILTDKKDLKRFSQKKRFSQIIKDSDK